MNIKNILLAIALITFSSASIAYDDSFRDFNQQQILNNLNHIDSERNERRIQEKTDASYGGRNIYPSQRESYIDGNGRKKYRRINNY